MKPLLKLIKSKGWTAKEVGERWGVKPRQMANIIKNPKQKDYDAVGFLPDKNSNY